MPKTDLSGDDLRFILDLSKTKSLTITAANFGWSIPTASRALGRLRLVFNDECFTRSGNSMLATHRLERLLPKIAHALEALEDIATEPTYRPEAIRRHFVIEMVDNAVVALLLPVIDEIRSKAPNIGIAIEALQGGTIERLRSGLIDLCFGYPVDDALPADVRSSPLFDSVHVCIVRKGHPLLDKLEEKRLAAETVAKADGREFGEAEREAVCLTHADLAAYRAVALSLPPWVGDRFIDVALRHSLPGNRPLIETPYFLSIPFYVMESDSYGFLPRESAQYFAKYLPIEILPLASDELRPWHPQILWHSRSNADYELQWLRSTIVRHFQRAHGGAEAVDIIR